MKKIFSMLSMKPVKNARGQVAIFVALIFQVLFLFFAMIINVGLLVHHKINLQNSVDLAAYYGASKQAEMLNGIGHINYQIRQSWKLLAWRYRQLGTAGDYQVHPFNKPFNKIQTPAPPYNVLGADEEGYPPNLDTPGISRARDYYEMPAFCITYSPFSPMPSNESMCKFQSEGKTIGLFKAPPVIAGFYAVNKAISTAAQKAIDAAERRCRFAGQFNYMILAEFMAAYNLDQGERKQLINMLSRGVSEAEDDFREIDGEKASVGIRKTLENNLTEANRNSLKMKIWNGLGQSGCNASGRASEEPSKWLSEIKITPGFAFTDFECKADSLAPHPKEMGSTEEKRPYNEDYLHEQIERLKQYVDPLKPPYNFSIGYEKNPWCMSYVGVSAETTPKIPFALGGITLKARAYAKPFGGKIGPWYVSQWASGSSQSSGGRRTDPLLPWRVGDASNTADFNDPTRIANYSRFVGDTAGMKSRAVQGQWARAIYNINADWSKRTPTAGDLIPDQWVPTMEPSFNHWSHLGVDFKEGKHGDILAWDSVRNSYPKMRDLELAAILPDQFDLTYYSIEPDFYHNFYLKIRDHYLQRVPGFTYLVRPDLGARLGNKDLEVFSVKDQYAVLPRVRTTDYQINDAKVDFDKKLLYVATDVSQVLTSWINKDLMDYSLDPERFGKCESTVDASKDGVPPTSGNCSVGGRTGYSVKMVSGEYLNSSDLDLGGDGAGKGRLLNPPDDKF
jgi:hypothetical protein